MASLKAVLQQASKEFLKGGGGVSSSVKKALRVHRQRQTIVLAVLALLLVVAAGLCSYLLLTGSSSWRQFEAVLGVGSGGMLEGLRRIWKDWTQTDLMLILIEDSGDAEIASLTKKLISRL
jgi:hypothetical protein